MIKIRYFLLWYFLFFFITLGCIIFIIFNTIKSNSELCEIYYYEIESFSRIQVVTNNACLISLLPKRRVGCLNRLIDRWVLNGMANLFGLFFFFSIFSKFYIFCLFINTNAHDNKILNIMSYIGNKEYFELYYHNT